MGLCGTTFKDGSPWDVPGTDPQWDCRTDRTQLGQLPRVGVLGMSRGLPMGLCGTTFKDGSPWDVPGTPNGTVGQLSRVGVLGMSWGLPHHSVGFGIVL